MSLPERRILIDDLDAQRHASFVFKTGEARTITALSTPSSALLVRSPQANHFIDPFARFQDPKIAAGTNGMNVLRLAREFDTEMQSHRQVDSNLEYGLASVSNDSEVLTRLHGISAYIVRSTGTYFKVTVPETSFPIRDPNQMVLLTPSWFDSALSPDHMQQLFQEMSSLHAKNVPIPAIFKQLSQLVIRNLQLKEDLGMALLSCRPHDKLESADRLFLRRAALYVSDNPKSPESSECNALLLPGGEGGMVIKGFRPTDPKKRSLAARTVRQSFERTKPTDDTQAAITHYFMSSIAEATTALSIFSDGNESAVSLSAGMFTADGNTVVVCHVGNCDTYVVEGDGTLTQFNDHDLSEDGLQLTRLLTSKELIHPHIYTIDLEPQDKYILLATAGLRSLYQNFPGRLPQIIRTQIRYYEQNKNTTVPTMLNGLLRNIYADAREVRKRMKDPDWQTLPYDLGLVMLARKPE